MKKLIWGILVLCFFMNGANAQNKKASVKKHEVYTGFGLVSTSSVMGTISDIVIAGFTGGHQERRNTSWSGNIHLGYKYAFTERIVAGLSYAYVKSAGGLFINDQKEGTVENIYNTFAAEFEYRYIARDNFKLYSVLGAGITPYKEKFVGNNGNKEVNNDTHFNFQVSAIGVKIGKPVGVFTELGFGYKGILSAGLFANF